MEETFQVDSGWLKRYPSENKQLISVTLEAFHVQIGCLKDIPCEHPIHRRHLGHVPSTDVVVEGLFIEE
jgi:hypothetical protein